MSQERPWKGGFVVFEGIDGSGTTTQCRMLAERVETTGRETWTTSEPTRGPVGRLLRDILAGRTAAAPETIAYLFAADRSDHLHGSNGIIDRLERGELVVCDRYKYSSLAYQSVENDCGLVSDLNRRFADPDIVFFVDLPASVAEQRIADRPLREIYERTEFQEQVRSRYLEVLTNVGRNVRVEILDGTEPQAAIAEKIWLLLGETSIL